MNKVLTGFFIVFTSFVVLVSCQKNDKDKNDSSKKCCSINEVNNESITNAENEAVQEIQDEVLITEDEDDKLDELRVSAEEALKSLEIEQDLIDLDSFNEQKVE
ncbi:MAG: hypothetical protein A3F40_03335 [Chlamydiae bacterium RIFCSPHIGHO2_12_FULL_27_8]|nr:MAG: hypothetical protein A3F40_03335 [Chlamydiae bacterium RIFCSPHIGHO2_12_FULL_27_8]OGN65913.1 MAG: hypothetical protein A2888_01010 [Chlamydiae bacterium RIFCSPLOWO2_01_FULL_28_7]